MTQSRRTLLRAVAGSALAGLAGCLADTGPGSPSATETPAGTGTPTGSPVHTPTTDGPAGSPDSATPTFTETPGTPTSPSIASAGLDSGEGRCGETATAAFSPTDSGIVVEGTIVTPDPCYRALLRNYHVEDRTAWFTVEALPDDADACEQCLAEVAWTLEATWGRGRPDAVAVRVEGKSPETFRYEI